MRGILFCLAILLLSCGPKLELGMNVTVDVAEGRPPALNRDGLREQTAGEFRWAVACSEEELAALIRAMPTETAFPAGELVITRLVVKNRQQRNPARASATLVAEAFWTQDDETQVITIDIKTHSVEMDHPDTQLPWLKAQARAGMWLHLHEAL